VRIEEVEGGYAVCDDSTHEATIDAAARLAGGKVPLVIADPPYGNILRAGWDRTALGADEFARWMLRWTFQWSRALLDGAAFYVWGGIGLPGFRPFLRYLLMVEEHFDDPGWAYNQHRPEFAIGLKLANLITWKKRRAYGVQHNYLFTREELAYFTKGDDIKRPRCFNVPLLEEKRGYAGYNPKYPAKSEHYRRSNVWADVTEVMRGKLHPAQKAQRVMEITIEVHTQPGEWVIDPFAGSGTTALAARKLGRRFVVVEKDEATFDGMLARLRGGDVNRAGGDVVSDHDEEG
jgi:DNA modification methylase